MLIKISFTTFLCKFLLTKIYWFSIILPIKDVMCLYKESDFVKEQYKTGEICRILNICKSTLINYDKQGKLPIRRTENNRRIIFRDDLLSYLDTMGLLDRTDFQKKDVIYARVSSHEQKTKGDLDRQAMFLVENAKDLVNPLVLKEVGSGLNDKRKKLQELIRMVCQGKVRRVFVIDKDRLTRFGFHYLESVFQEHGVSIVVMKDTDEEKKGQEDLVEDMEFHAKDKLKEIEALLEDENVSIEDIKMVLEDAEDE